MRTIDEKKHTRMRVYLKRGWRTIDEIMMHAGLSRRTAYRWLGGLWHELVKRGSRGQTEYKITN